MIGGSVALILLAAAGVYFRQGGGGESDNGAGETVGEPAARQADTPERGEVKEVQGGQAKRYVSEPYGFSFQVPSDFSLGEFDEAGGRLVLVQAPSAGSGQGTGGQDDPSSTSGPTFQVFITAWDEPEQSLTPERIREDVPDLVIRRPEALSMEGGSRQALTFVGESERFGTTREVWMVNDGWLFQVITSAENQKALSKILNTWQFL